jgi:hypothetical protein
MDDTVSDESGILRLYRIREFLGNLCSEPPHMCKFLNHDACSRDLKWVPLCCLDVDRTPQRATRQLGHEQQWMAWMAFGMGGGRVGGFGRTPDLTMLASLASLHKLCTQNGLRSHATGSTMANTLTVTRGKVRSGRASSSRLAVGSVRLDNKIRPNNAAIPCGSQRSATVLSLCTRSSLLYPRNGFWFFMDLRISHHVQRRSFALPIIGPS